MTIKVDRDGLWDVLRIYGIGGKLLRAVQSFYCTASAQVKVGDEVNVSFGVDVGVRQMHHVTMAVQHTVYMDCVIRE